MNNAKVRIYELSKDLNLENKDILEICDKLNISVKSHSSTISESDAERIKVMAEKYVPSHAPEKSHGSTPPERGAIGERKQQILAIHHKQARAEGQPSGKAAAQLMTPPPRPALQLPTPLEEIYPQAEPAAAPVGNGGVQAEALASQHSVSPVQSVQGEEKVPKSPQLEAPQMFRPPARLSQKSPEVKVEISPTLLAPQPVSKPEVAPYSPESKPKKPKELKKAEKVPVEAGDKKPEAKAKPELQKLQKPQPPQKPKPPASLKAEPDLEVAIATEEGEPVDEELLEAEELAKIAKKPKLKRPTLPGKREEWEEEDDEKQDHASKAGKTAGKVGKSGSKGKRVAQMLLDEDDEDLDSDLDAISLPAALSLSVARPPKPKSDAQYAAASSASGSKPKKAAPKTDMGETRAKTERRDRASTKELPREIILSGSLTVREMAEKLGIPETDIIKHLFLKGIAVNVTQTLEFETAKLVAEELGVQVETEAATALATKTTEMLDVADLEKLQRRPPVVTIMGHVDHGKTTLLDSIRKTKVALGEAGGITQHIGAYHVDVEHNGKQEQIVFLDTPGHEAFTAMRARGARVTDIAILVVAADDGVQPQTREAVSHAKAAGVPIVVAINKIDKPDAQADRIKQELSELGLVPEEWGGDTIMVPVSALKGENLDGLLEMILLVSEVQELSANPDRPAKGTVIEANLDRTRGPVATLLVQNGTLRVGETIVAGSVQGKIRAMIDDRGEKVEAATPSFAVEVLGLNDVPAAGDEFDVFENEREARAIAEQRTDEKRQSRLQQALSSRRVSLSTLSAQAQEGELKELNLILKADVQGSLEAILSALKQLPQKEVQIRVLLAAPGEITETDVDLAAASGAVIVGFNTTLASGARSAADREGVDIREYNIIYKLLDEIQAAMEGLLAPEEVEESLGQAEVRAVFPVGRGAVAGCYVQSGKVVRNRFVRVRRGNEIVYQGILDSLKRMKEDAKEVAAGYECGIGLSKFNDWKEGDIIEAYEMVLKRRTLSVN